MPPLQFRLPSTLRRAQRLTRERGVRISLPGVVFAGEVASADTAVLQLLLSALNQESLQSYWNMTECCEGCIQTSRPLIHRIASLVRLARSALGSDAAPATTVLLSALDESLREFREYIRGFTPDEERNVPWGDGSRSDYLHAMRVLRHHLESVLQQLLRYTGSMPASLHRRAGLEEWPREAYTVFNEPLP